MSEAPLICTVAIELSRSRWMIGVLPPRSTKVAVSAVASGDTGRLLVQLHQLQGNRCSDPTFFAAGCGTSLTILIWGIVLCLGLTIDLSLTARCAASR